MLHGKYFSFIFLSDPININLLNFTDKEIETREATWFAKNHAARNSSNQGVTPEFVSYLGVGWG